MPPWGSAARQPMASLTASERGLFSLLGIMERGQLLPAGDLLELRVAAEQTAATMAATAAEVVSMEKTVKAVKAAPLVDLINVVGKAVAGKVYRHYQDPSHGLDE